MITASVVLKNNVKAEESNEKYSIDYLLKHYNAVTLGTKDNNILEEYKKTLQGTNKGDIKNLSVEGSVLARGEYTNKSNENVDFDKMYAQVMNESILLVENTEYHLNDYYISIDKPGNYMINNAPEHNTEYYYSGLYERKMNDQYQGIGYNVIQINNYSPNELYIFNVMDTMTTKNFVINIMKEGMPAATSLKEYIENGNYNGNIIFNYPNAKYIRANIINGHIIAPKADVYLKDSYNRIWDSNSNQYVYNKENQYYGTIIANSIIGSDNTELKNQLKKTSTNLLNETGKNYIEENKDFPDDIYSDNYDLSTLLKNYNVISLGQKEYQPNTKYATLGYNMGSTSIFHIASQFLVNGDLGIEGEEYPGADKWNYFNSGLMRFDLDSNLVTESYLQGTIKPKKFYPSGYAAEPYSRDLFYIKYWEAYSQKRGSKNYLFRKADEYKVSQSDYTLGYIEIPDNYLNFSRLYENIVSEQNAIEEGKKVKTGENGVVHIPIGGNYTIEDISNVNEIMFDNFEKNKDELTIVTIKNSGNINFPLISKDTGSYKGIPTNDYYGKTVANQEYEMDGLLPDEYHGNIIFNVPNANYIKLAPNAPFAGHLIAPNADLETEETQLAGCMIVNSLYAEGGSEAHFYPITANLKCDCDGYQKLSESMKRRFSAYRLGKLLGKSSSMIETTVLGEQSQYQNDQATLENVLKECPNSTQHPTNPIVDIITNPKTYRNLGFIIILGGLITYTIMNNKNKMKTEK